MNIEMLKEVINKGYTIIIKKKRYYVFSCKNKLVYHGRIDGVLTDEDIYWNKMLIKNHDDNHRCAIDIGDFSEPSS